MNNSSATNNNLNASDMNKQMIYIRTHPHFQNLRREMFAGPMQQIREVMGKFEKEFMFGLHKKWTITPEEARETRKTFIQIEYLFPDFMEKIGNYRLYISCLYRAAGIENEMDFDT